MRVEFDVHGNSAEELRQRAHETLEQLEPGHEWACVILTVRPSVQTNAGQVTSWTAEVEARDSDYPR